jgi:integrase
MTTGHATKNGHHKPDYGTIDKLVRRLPRPQKGHLVYTESRLRNEAGLTGPWQPGLGVRIYATDNGHDVWISDCRYQGREKQKALGEIASMPARIAFEEAARRRLRASLGQDPDGEQAAERAAQTALRAAAKAARELAKGEHTVAQVCDRFEAAHLPKLTAGSTQKAYKNIIDRQIRKRLGHLKAGDTPKVPEGEAVPPGYLTAEIAQDEHDKISAINGPQAARMFAVILCSMMGNKYAVRWGWRSTPLRGVKWQDPKERETYLTHEQIRRVKEELARELAEILEKPLVTSQGSRKEGRARTSRKQLELANIDARDIILLALDTGARIGNVLAMEWEEISFATGFWTVPADKTKTDAVYKIRLSSTVIEILQRRRTEADNRQSTSAWVFESPSRAGKHRGYCWMWDIWKRVRDKIGLAHVRIHDMRHTAGSAMAQACAKAGVLPTAVQRQLGHKNFRSTQRYMHLYEDALCNVAELASTGLHGPAPVKPDPPRQAPMPLLERLFKDINRVQQK